MCAIFHYNPCKDDIGILPFISYRLRALAIHAIFSLLQHKSTRLPLWWKKEKNHPLNCRALCKTSMHNAKSLYGAWELSIQPPYLKENLKRLRHRRKEKSSVCLVWAFVNTNRHDPSNSLLFWLTRIIQETVKSNGKIRIINRLRLIRHLIRWRKGWAARGLGTNNQVRKPDWSKEPSNGASRSCVWTSCSPASPRWVLLHRSQHPASQHIIDEIIGYWKHST